MTGPNELEGILIYGLTPDNNYLLFASSISGLFILVIFKKRMVDQGVLVVSCLTYTQCAVAAD